ncbi:MAG: hypothetical protein HY554_14155 [Elusimicrobia bacterium]|nr:hypothetical protein [Elusimicrobiota bacterium]
MNRWRAAYSLSACLCCGLAAPARAAVTLVAPVDMNDKVDEVRDVVAAPDFDPNKAHFISGVMFEQLQHTHHIPYAAQWYNPTRVSVAPTGGTPDVAGIMDRYRTLVTIGPPSPLLQDRDKDEQQQRAFLRMEELRLGNRILRDGEGGRREELPKEALAAYVAKSFDAADTATGMVLLQTYFFDLAEYLGEFVIETAVHEGAHAEDHHRGDLDPVKKQAQELRAMTRSYDFITRFIPDARWKFSHLCQQVMNDHRAPDYVKATLAHIGNILRHGDQGDMAEYVKELYRDGYERHRH